MVKILRVVSGMFGMKNGKNMIEQQQTSIVAAAVILMASVFLSSLTGLLSYRLLASRFYNENSRQQQDLDAYWVAFQPSDLMFQLFVVGALSAAFIPIFTKYRKKDEESAFVFASSTLNIILLLFVVFGVLVVVFSKQLIMAMTGDSFSTYQIGLAAKMTSIMVIAQILLAISNVFSGILQSYQRFIVPAFSPVFYNLGIIFGTIFLTPFVGIYGPVYGVVIGAFAHMAIQYPLLRKLGFRCPCTIKWNHPGLKEMAMLSVPRTLSVGIDLVQPYVFTFFITSMSNVNLTLMRFAMKLMAIPIRLFGVPIGQAALPFLSEQSDADQRKAFNALLLQSIHQIAFFSLPASVLLLILKVPIVRFAYGARNVPWPDTVLTARIVLILSLSVAAQAIWHVLVRACYALEDTKGPFVVSILSMIASVVGGWYVTFYTEFKLLGLAGVIAFCGVLEATIMFFYMYKKAKFSMVDALYPLVKMANVSICMAYSLYFPLKALDLVVINTSKTVGLLILTSVVCAIGMAVYIFLSWLLKIKELSMITKIWSKMAGWQKNLSKSFESIETGAVGVEEASS